MQDQASSLAHQITAALQQRSSSESGPARIDVPNATARAVAGFQVGSGGPLLSFAQVQVTDGVKLRDVAGNTVKLYLTLPSETITPNLQAVPFNYRSYAVTFSTEHLYV